MARRTTPLSARPGPGRGFERYRAAPNDVGLVQACALTPATAPQPGDSLTQSVAAVAYALLLVPHLTRTACTSGVTQREPSAVTTRTCCWAGRRTSRLTGRPRRGCWRRCRGRRWRRGRTGR